MWGVSFQSHQPRLMAGRSWRGSLAEPDLCKCGLQKDFNSNNRGKEKWVGRLRQLCTNKPGCKSNPRITWLLWGHWRAILARFVQLPVSICQSVVGSLHSRGTGSPHFWVLIWENMEGGLLQPCQRWVFLVCVGLCTNVFTLSLCQSVNGMAACIYLLVTEWTCWGLCPLVLVYCMLKLFLLIWKHIFGNQTQQ